MALSRDNLPIEAFAKFVLGDFDSSTSSPRFLARLESGNGADWKNLMMAMINASAPDSTARAIMALDSLMIRLIAMRYSDLKIVVHDPAKPYPLGSAQNTLTYQISDQKWLVSDQPAYLKFFIAIKSDVNMNIWEGQIAESAAATCHAMQTDGRVLGIIVAPAQFRLWCYEYRRSENVGKLEWSSPCLMNGTDDLVGMGEVIKTLSHIVVNDKTTIQSRP